MAKKIDNALKQLVKALKKHAEVTGARRVSVKQATRAATKVREAADAYAAEVHARTGLPSPLADLIDPGLDEATIRSLKSERDAVYKRHAVA